MRVDVKVPKGWHELTQEQLGYLLNIILSVQAANQDLKFDSPEDYALQVSVQIRTRCFFRWAGLRLVCPYGTGYLVRHGSLEFMLTAEIVTDCISHLEWISTLPSEPVRLDTVDGAVAIPADLSSGLSFDSWLALETIWQRYQFSQDNELLRQMAAILYRKEDINPDPAETLGIFYWWSGVKNMVSAMFPNLFKLSGNGSDTAEPPSFDEIRRNIDTQIRALTKGDITKEREILAFDAMRALTELDAQAREYDEIRKKYPSS